jgi:hypothetical protein
MILAIRALRATIFAFNASIWVSRPALASVTDAVAVIAVTPSTDEVIDATNAPPETGAYSDDSAADLAEAFVPFT